MEYLLRPNGPNPSRLAKSKFVNRAYQKVLFNRDFRGVQQAWRKAATRLLALRYGIDPPNPGRPAKWEAWKAVLGELRPEHFKGVLLLLAFQATGWSALAATYIEPSLRTRPYIAFTFFTIAYGIIRDWGWVKSYYHPVSRSLLILRSVLDEIQIVGIAGGPDAAAVKK